MRITTLTAITRSLAFVIAGTLLGAACPPDRALYILEMDPNDRMRIVPSADEGDIWLVFSLGERKASIRLSAVLELAHFQRLDGAHKPVGLDREKAPAYIRIEGLSKISDAPDGEWKLSACLQ